MELVEVNSTILVLNSSYEPLHFTSWKRAIVLLFKNKAKYISKRVIRLVNYVRLPFTKVIHPTRSLIYKRDDHQCQYCGSTEDLTLDHIIPKSKGGGDTWDNLVTCCIKCNSKKGNKYLKETDLVLRNKPTIPFNKTLLDVQKSKISEWKEYLYH